MSYHFKYEDGLFEGSIEPLTCSSFGCGRTLSPIEQLTGSYCTHHMKRDAIDPTKWVQHDERVQFPPEPTVWDTLNKYSKLSNANQLT